MQKEEYQKMYKLERFYWWFVGRRYIIKSFLDKFLKTEDNHILEVGCGTGGNLKLLQEYGKVMGIDISEEAIKFCRNSGFGNVLLGDAEKMNFSDEDFDLLIALDLLEHIENDESSLREMYRVLKKRGKIILTVPAYQFLWSDHDEALCHQKRYSIKELKRKLNNAGFSINKISYCVSFVFPGIFIFKIFGKIFFGKNKKKKTPLVILPKFINNFFISLLRLEAFLLGRLNFPFGCSIICLAQKNRQD